MNQGSVPANVFASTMHTNAKVGNTDRSATFRNTGDLRFFWNFHYCARIFGEFLFSPFASDPFTLIGLPFLRNHLYLYLP